MYGPEGEGLLSPLLFSRQRMNAAAASIPKTAMYQYTAIDDCSRFRVLGLYKRRTAKNTLLFMERVMEEMPFPIQRIQTDRGTEFFAIKVQEFFMEQSIKFRPIKPGSPHLNGKVD